MPFQQQVVYGAPAAGARPYSVAQMRAKAQLKAAMATSDDEARARRLGHALSSGVLGDGPSPGVVAVKQAAQVKLSAVMQLRAGQDSAPALMEVDAKTMGRADVDSRGSYDWLRKANDEPDREARRKISALTSKAINCGGYTLGDVSVRLPRVNDMLKRTRLVHPSAGSDWPLTGAKCQPKDIWKCATKVVVQKGSSVIDGALERCKAGKKVVAVNAASSYHAGGGFTSGGRHALEEAICMQSTLYPSLDKAMQLATKAGVHTVEWARPAKDKSGEDWHAHIPDDGVILSPCVDVFRQGTFQGYAFEKAAVGLEAIVSVAMPNCNDRMSDSPVDSHPDPQEYQAQLDRKWRATLAAAAFFTSANSLVVPDAGCGVFRNPPEQVGASLGRVLREEFMGRFDEVYIAFPGGSAGERFAASAVTAFGG